MYAREGSSSRISYVLLQYVLQLSVTVIQSATFILSLIPKALVASLFLSTKNDKKQETRSTVGTFSFARSPFFTLLSIILVYFFIYHFCQSSLSIQFTAKRT